MRKKISNPVRFLYSEALLHQKLSEKDVKTLQDFQHKRYSTFVKSVNKANDHRTKVFERLEG